MNDLPPELHFKIYAGACTDDGTTGSALSRVSRRIREFSAPYRYQSIAVCGPIQIHQLAESLSAVPPELRRIRFLFMYDHASLSKRQGVVGPIPARSRPRRRRGFLDFPGPEIVPHSIAELVGSMDLSTIFDDPRDLLAHQSVANLRLDMVEILSVAQQTVELLSLVSFNEAVDNQPLLRGTFPSLTRLTIRGPHPLPRHPTFAPNLITLDITDDALGNAFAATLAQNHPSLLVLRIARCQDPNGRIADVFQLAHVMGIITSTENNPPPRLLPRPRRLRLEPCDLERGGGALRFRMTMEILQKFTIRCPRFQLLPPHPGHGKTKEARCALEKWTLGVPMLQILKSE